MCPPCVNSVTPAVATLQAIPTDKAVPNIKIPQNVAMQATNVANNVVEKTKSLFEDVTEHFPNWVKDTAVLVGDKASQIIKHASENPKAYIAGGALAALTAGILIGRNTAQKENDKPTSLEEAIIRDFLSSK